MWWRVVDVALGWYMRIYDVASVFEDAAALNTELPQYQKAIAFNRLTTLPDSLSDHT